MKYNWSIIGHEKQLAMIEQDLTSGNLAHAYLLVGQNSVGKNTVAKKLAGILQCKNDFCHECSDCLQVERGSHVDTIFMQNDHNSIKVEQMRRLTEQVNLTKQSRYKVVIIENIERMTAEAANSFLKTLEEPPRGTIFILTANNLRALLKTVVSRVRVIKFGPSSASELRRKLGELFKDGREEDLERASLFSGGRSGKAIQLMESPEDLFFYNKVYQDIQNFLERRNIVERFSYVDDLLVESEKIGVFLGMLKNVLRTRILDGRDKNGNYMRAVEDVGGAQELLKSNVNPRLLLENLMLKI